MVQSHHFPFWSFYYLLLKSHILMLSCDILPCCFMILFHNSDYLILLCFILILSSQYSSQCNNKYPVLIYSLLIPQLYCGNYLNIFEIPKTALKIWRYHQPTYTWTDKLDELISIFWSLTFPTFFQYNFSGYIWWQSILPTSLFW